MLYKIHFITDSILKPEYDIFVKAELIYKISKLLNDAGYKVLYCTIDDGGNKNVF